MNVEFRMNKKPQDAGEFRRSGAVALDCILTLVSQISISNNEYWMSNFERIPRLDLHTSTPFGVGSFKSSKQLLEPPDGNPG